LRALFAAGTVVRRASCNLYFAGKGLAALLEPEETKMRNIGRHVFWAVALLACSSIGAFAESMTLTGVGLDGVMGGVYTSPYSVTAGGTPMLLICDDFTFNIPTVPYSWTAQTTSLTSLQGETTPSTSVKFGETSSQKTPELQPGTCTAGNTACAQTQVFDYATASVLAAELLALPSYNNEEAGDLSYAIWGIFDPTLLSNNPTSGEGSLSQTGTVPGLTAAQDSTGDLGAAKYYLSQAQAVVNADTKNGTINLGALPQLTIYTAVGTPDSQEFLGITMAEPSYPAVLALDLLAVAGLILAFRRRIAGMVN
jgi:hypothetical protein